MPASNETIIDSGLITNLGGNFNQAIAPRLGWAPVPPVDGLWSRGDRIMNSLWNGQINPGNTQGDGCEIGWVCVKGGIPGIWKPVFGFGYGINKDSYFKSFAGGSGLWTSLDTGSSTSVFGENGVTLNTDAGSNTAGLQQSNVPCCVPNELVVLDWTVSSRVNNALFRIRMAQDVSSQTADGASNSVEKTIANGASTPGQLWIYNITASSSIKVNKVVVRPKYPFLTKAPSSFTAAPSGAQARGVPGTLGIWEAISGLPSPTYSAGNVILGSNYGIIQSLPSALIPNKTYRVRINRVTAPGSLQLFMRRIGNLNPVSVTITLATGIQEVTFSTIYSDVYQLEIYSAAADNQFNYVRLYAA